MTPEHWRRLNECITLHTPVGVVLNICFAWLGYRAGAVNLDGAVVGISLGLLVTIGTGWQGFAMVALFVVLGSLATMFRYGEKASRGVAEARGGRRQAAHAMANLGVPAVAALTFGVTQTSVAVTAFVAALSTSLLDTLSTEIGKSFPGPTWSALTGCRVPPGTPGGVSVSGTLAGICGAVLLASIGYGLQLIPSWREVLVVVAAAVAAGWIESMINAAPSLRSSLGHHGTNVLNTFLGASIAVGLSILLT